MSLLNVTVRKATLSTENISPQASIYVILKLQHVKSTTVPTKGPQPSWEQDFLFEIDDIETGLLIEVWDKGMLWDKAIGYFWAPLQSLQFSAVEPGGTWFPLHSEVVLEENGQILCTRNPTGHRLLIDYRFELPCDFHHDVPETEIELKLEHLNHIMSQNWPEDPNMYYSHSGFSEDSDYTSDLNFPINGKLPNAAASSSSQYLATAFQSKNSGENRRASEDAADSTQSLQRPRGHSNGFVDPGGGTDFQTSTSSSQATRKKDKSADRAERDQNTYSYGAYEYWDADNGYEYDNTGESEGWYQDDRGEWHQDPEYAKYYEEYYKQFYDYQELQKQQERLQNIERETAPQSRKNSTNSLSKRTTSSRKDSTASEKSLVTRVATKRASIASITNTGGSGAEDSRQDIHELNAKNTCLSSSSGTTTTAAAGAGEISGGAKRSRGRISSTSSSSDFIPYGGLEQEQALQYYAEQGWCLDEFGEWFHDPASASAFLEKRRKSSTASSTNTASTTAAATSATSKAAANLPGSTGGSSTVVGKNTKPAQNQKSDKNQNAHMPSSTPAMSQTIMPDNYEEGWYQDEYGNWLNQFDWKQDENGEWYYEDSSYNQEGGEGNEGYEGWYQDETGEWIYDENQAASSTNKSTTESTTTNGSLDKNNVANAVANENIVDQGAKAKTVANGDVRKGSNAGTIKKESESIIVGNKTESSAAAAAASKENGSSSLNEKLPPRPADYDYYWYQDEDGNWRNEYDDYGYVFDPDRYEGDESASAASEGSNKEAAKTVIKNDELDKPMVPPAQDYLSTPSPGDRSQLSLNLSDGITGSLQKNKKSGKVQKLPPRPEDYDDYWYQDEGGEWRNEYDDEGYVFADDEYDPDEAEEIVQAIKKEGKARAEAERDQLAASLATTTNASLIGIIESGVYDENGQLVTIITGDAEYRSNIARQRWHWAFTKIVQISWLTKDGFSHEEAKNLTKEGFYDDDGNWVYYEQCPPEPAQNKVTQPLQQPNNTAQVKPPLLQNQNQKQQQQTKTPHEVQAAKDEAAKAAQEAAKAAKEASKGLFKGLTSFGGNVKNQAQQQQQQAQGKGGGGLFGGIMKAAASTAAQAATGPEPPKPKQPVLKPQNPNFPKPYTNNMTAKQRWQWAYRRIVQISWLTKQGYSGEYIAEVISSDALNEKAEDALTTKQKDQADVHNQAINQDLKAAQDAAKAATGAAKGVLGGMVGLGGSLLGKNAPKLPAGGGGQQPGPGGLLKPGQQPAGKIPTGGQPGGPMAAGNKQVTNEANKPEAAEDKHVKFADADGEASKHKSTFVKHINKTRTMSAKQKWDWAFDKILQVGGDK